MRIAVDAMGGDDAPKQPVRGSILAVEADPNLEVILVGDEGKILASLEKGENLPKNISIKHTSTQVEMGDVPVRSLKEKTDASIVITVDLVKKGEAQGLVAAGNTGAVVACTMMNLDLIEGVKRAGIAAPMPAPGGFVYLMDVGANVNCKPEHLLQYALMGSSCYEAVTGVKRARVGLLSVGKEGQKGNELVKEAYRLFQEVDLDFRGNVEGNCLFDGEVDVIVCEGFVGNVILKSYESFAENLLGQVEDHFREKDPAGKYHEFWKEIVGQLAGRFKYSSVGGAPLLGVNGTCIIGHGRSDAVAIQNAIRVAKECVERDVNEKIRLAVRNLTNVTPQRS